jgi:hypothetical protein
MKYSHQFIAHAGDSRSLGWRELNVTFDQVVATQKAIIQVLQIVTAVLLQGPSFGEIVPIQYKPFDRFDRLVSHEALEKTREFRTSIERDRNSWLQNQWNSPDLLTVIGWPEAPRPHPSAETPD